MRRLRAPLARWLDRRIDARIAVRLGGERLPAGLRPLADAAAEDMRAVTALHKGKR